MLCSSGKSGRNFNCNKSAIVEQTKSTCFFIPGNWRTVKLEDWTELWIRPILHWRIAVSLIKWNLIWQIYLEMESTFYYFKLVWTASRINSSLLSGYKSTHSWHVSIWRSYATFNSTLPKIAFVFRFKKVAWAAGMPSILDPELLIFTIYWLATTYVDWLKHMYSWQLILVSRSVYTDAEDNALIISTPQEQKRERLGHLDKDQSICADQ